MSRLGPYNQRQIDGDFVLTELQKLGNLVFAPKFHLTKEWVLHGDSLSGTGFPWTPLGDFIRDITNTTYTNNAIGGRCIEYPVVEDDLMAALMTDFSLANKSTVCQFGVNDYRSLLTLYKNQYAYQQNALSTLLTLSVPQNKIITAQEFEIRTGTWVDFAARPWALQNTSRAGSYIETTVVGRFISVCFILLSDASNNLWSINVDGVEVNYNTIPKLVGENFGQSFSVLIDTGESGPHVLRIVSRGAGGAGSQWVDYACAFDYNDPDARNVLMVLPYVYDYQGRGDTGGSIDDYNIVMGGLKNAAEACKKAGLPVFLYQPDNASVLYRDDFIHPTSTSLNILAKDIVKGITYAE